MLPLRECIGNNMQQVVYILLSFTDMFTQDVQASEGHMDERNTEIQAPTVLSTDSAQHVQIVEEDDTVDNVVDWHNNCMVPVMNLWTNVQHFYAILLHLLGCLDWNRSGNKCMVPVMNVLINVSVSPADVVLLFSSFMVYYSTCWVV